tara:strand:+ start:716 stop:1264 length:549 start_codon:yes stop_codon:yes gene_type:complete
MSTIGVAAGHTRKTEGERLYEHRKCCMAAEHLADMLAEAGHIPITVPEALYDIDNDSSLRRRVTHFNNSNTDLNVALHLNAGGGNYSTTIHYPGSLNGTRLAECVEDAVAFMRPHRRSIGAKSQNYFDRHLHMLMATSAPSVIVEPGFKDHETHRAWMDSQSFAIDYAAMVFVGIQRYVALP